MSSSNDQVASQDGQRSLESVRNDLMQQEDTIIFSLIERSKYKSNRLLYDEWYLHDAERTFLEFFVMETETLQKKCGRYETPEEYPFYEGSELGGEFFDENNAIWVMYVNELLPLIVSEGKDENRTCVAARDLECLQALSRRIHYGKIVAEVKFKDNPEVYTKAIKAKDDDALRRLITCEKVEEEVIKRVKKKAMVFGQDVSVVDKESDEEKYKVDPSVVGSIFEQGVMPLTKIVQVEYLLHRLD